MSALEVFTLLKHRIYDHILINQRSQFHKIFSIIKIYINIFKKLCS